jgi:PPOX class probable F420-dependent enzyme
MDAYECRVRFGPAKLARLATVTPSGRPHLVPVTFALADDQIVFAVDHKPKTTTALQRLANIATEPRVAFLVDHDDDDWSRLWWVRADADAAIITSGDDHQRAIDLLAAKYPQYRRHRPSGVVVMSQVSRWTGWAAR